MPQSYSSLSVNDALLRAAQARLALRHVEEKEASAGPVINRVRVTVRMGLPDPQHVGDNGEVITYGAGAQIFTYTRPWIADYQLSAIFNPLRYAIIEASTKSGKTHGCILWLVEQAMRGEAGYQYWWVAPVYTQAAIAYRRLKAGLPSGTFKANGTDRTITLANGATIWFKSAEKPDNLYGEDVHAAVMDEASRIREESWHAVRSTLTATRGLLRIIGNVKGRKNWAYKLARLAEGGAAGMAYAKITAHDAAAAGILAPEEIEDAKALLPEAVFNELYLAIPTDDGGNPFGLGAIARAIMAGGALSHAQPVCWAWDLAKSTDWTVGIGLDAEGKVCRFERWNMTALPPAARSADGIPLTYWQLTEQRIVDVTRGVPALVESNGIGDPVLEGIQRAALLKGQRNFEGFTTTATSKQQILEGLAVAIQQLLIGLPDRLDTTGIPIVDELEEFEYLVTRTGVKYSAPEGLHDDCVMALAMVWALFDATPAGPEGTVIYDQRVEISRY